MEHERQRHPARRRRRRRPGPQTRTDTANFGFRVRSGVSVDLRTQTEYGTLRSYMDVGAQWSAAVAGSTADNNAAVADTLWVDRGFIQFAGFTAGRIRSYFDINSFAPYGYSNVRMSGDTGALGIYGIAYTAQFGNGITASISFEDNGQASGGRGHFDLNMAMGDRARHDRVRQQRPAGSGRRRCSAHRPGLGLCAGVGALHDASAGYYGGANSTLNGHPSDAWGFAVSGGFTLNDILGFKGDTFGMQACFSEGAAGYCTRATGAWQMYSSGNNAGFGWVSDGVYDNAGLAAGGSNVELTTVWGINGYMQHLWSPRWRTSLYGGYVEVDYNGTATNLINQHLPTPPLGGTVRCGRARRRRTAARRGRPAMPARRTSAGGSSARGRSGTRIPISTSALMCCGRTSTRRTRARTSLWRQRRASGRPLRHRRPGHRQRDVPHPAELPALIV